MKYHFKVHSEGNGYWTECIELPGCVTEADSMEELKENAQEALELYLDEPSNSDHVADLPSSAVVGENIMKVPVSPNIAFPFLLRSFRLSHGMIQRQVAELLGITHLYAYQRLERNCNPRLSTVYEIKNIFPEFPIEQLLS